ncbi:u24-ctenitoxin-Pn1a [Trichonephila inaurata madagascariensis]|uniref:U24-ctenitoxin-Pn1a n=1 Tax=Trichonephila inaurata madagascariensis TaxID=2747483 RepID=A0A8X6MHY7_9ARAC|nr:u24-ctenitoxin-Pn1a [Trichonephila inaurata madagascariensis]
MVPNCDANGDYMPMQCYQGSNMCSCYDKSGNPITQPSTTLKSCKCLVERHEVESRNLIGSYIPQCEEDGTYQKSQCVGSIGVCFCVNPMTGEKKGDVTRGGVNC